MAVDRQATGPAELAIDGIGRPDRDPEEPVVAECALPRDGRLDQVAHGIELVAPGQVPVLAAWCDDLDEGVQVAVRPLRRGDQGDRFVGMAGERGQLVVEERAAASASETEKLDAAERRCIEAVATAGGGRLGDAVRRDPTDGIRRLLARAVWLPDLATCLTIQAALPPGWIAVPRDGSAVVDDLTVTLGAPESILERRAEHTRLAAEVDRVDAELAVLRVRVEVVEAAAATARTDLEGARSAEAQAAGERRRAEEAERAAARDVEALSREAAWHAAQTQRIAAEVARFREAVAAMTTPASSGADRVGVDTASSDAGGDGVADAATATAVWERRADELRERRDRLAARLATHDAARRDAEHRRARADATATMAEERIARSERDAAALAEQAAALAADREALRVDVAAASTAAQEAGAALATLHAADAADRSRLSDAERAASAARERLRAADDRLRTADHAELEARLGLESLREGVLVELAGMGELALTSLGMVTTDVAAIGTPDPSTTPDDLTLAADDARTSDDTEALEAALAVVAETWAAQPPTVPAPAPGRLAQLRRRYHELGAANPFAVEEYAELRTRLDGLETQGADLRSAIGKTRELIAELDTMIADQFRTTFEALEAAFERRFEQLFGGGFARLSLTDPSDLGSTGVEIVARPPGKKAQALAMLSGGERALTAVALLFAMLEVRPVPFCVLDEVDAALDEANIGRFADALKSLAHQTQFIVITHNRGTIEAADALYGVTVGDDSVSRVISLRLDEAQALASDRRRELATVD